jgi:hypothetical protein
MHLLLLMKFQIPFWIHDQLLCYTMSDKLNWWTRIACLDTAEAMQEVTWEGFITLTTPPQSFSALPMNVPSQRPLSASVIPARPFFSFFHFKNAMFILVCRKQNHDNVVQCLFLALGLLILH